MQQCVILSFELEQSKHAAGVKTTKVKTLKSATVKGKVYSDIYKTWQLKSKQSRQINGTTGMKRTMYFGFWGELSL